MRRISLVALVVLVCDLLTKWIVNRDIPLYAAPQPVIGQLVRFTNVRNAGSAFSLVQGGRIFFIAFSVISILLILSLARSPRLRSTPAAISLGMILGGALGNLSDRIIRGAVTDWIDMGIGDTRWPTYNVADIGLTVGVILLVLLLLRGPRETEAGESPRGSPDSADRPASP